MDLADRADVLRAETARFRKRAGDLGRSPALAMVPGLRDALPGMLALLDEFAALQQDMARELERTNRGQHGATK